MKKTIITTALFFISFCAIVAQERVQEKIETRPLDQGPKPMWLEIKNPINGNKVTTPVQWYGSYVKNNLNLSLHIKEKTILMKVSLLSILGILMEGKESEYISFNLSPEDEKMETNKILLFSTPTTVLEIKVYE